LKSYSCWRVVSGGSLMNPIMRSADLMVVIIGF